MDRGAKRPKMCAKRCGVNAVGKTDVRRARGQDGILAVKFLAPTIGAP